MQWRVTFFVEGATRTPEGWSVTGEAGLGPPQAGDAFSFVHHQDSGEEDDSRLLVIHAEQHDLVLRGGTEVDLRPGDILGGEVDR